MLQGRFESESARTQMNPKRVGTAYFNPGTAFCEACRSSLIPIGRSVAQPQPPFAFAGRKQQGEP
jgi:hypothetical protein